MASKQCLCQVQVIVGSIRISTADKLAMPAPSPMLQSGQSASAVAVADRRGLGFPTISPQWASGAYDTWYGLSHYCRMRRCKCRTHPGMTQQVSMERFFQLSISHVVQRIRSRCRPVERVIFIGEGLNATVLREGPVQSISVSTPIGQMHTRTSSRCRCDFHRSLDFHANCPWRRPVRVATATCLAAVEARSHYGS